MLQHNVFEQDDADKMHYLIEEGLVDKDFIDPDSGTSMLHLAASLYSIGTALVLLEAGAAVNLVDPDGVTPLHYAIGRMNNSRYSGINRYVNKAHGEAEAMVDILLYYGAGDDRNVQDKTGNTPLHVAASLNEPFIIQKLIRSGAWWHLQTKNVDGYTAQELALNNKKEMEEWYTVPARSPPILPDDYDHCRRMRAVEGKGYDAPDFKVPIETTEYNTYQNMIRTIELLEEARVQYDKYFFSITELGRRGIPDDIIRTMVHLPATFRPEVSFNGGRCRTPQRIFEGLLRLEWLSINGVVRRILYPSNDLDSSSSDEEDWDDEWDGERLTVEMMQLVWARDAKVQRARQRASLTPSQAMLWYM